MCFYLRIGSRAISSVVPKSDLEVRDFSVANEPVLTYLPASQERNNLIESLDRSVPYVPMQNKYLRLQCHIKRFGGAALVEISVAEPKISFGSDSGSAEPQIFLLKDTVP
jgi:hypothetical protein